MCLQSGIELLQGWCAAKFMKINTNKTRIITAKLGLLPSRRKQVFCVKVYILRTVRRTIHK